MTERNPPADEWRTVLAKPVDTARFDQAVSNITLDVAALSDCGKVAAHNTDHYLALRLGRLQETLASSLSAGDLPARFEEYAYAMVVADGLGEQGAGARASRVALSTLAHLAVRYGRWNVRVEAEDREAIVNQIEFFSSRLNEAVLDERRLDLRLATMATSLTAVYIAGTELFFAHAGHSKAFLFREGTLIQLTTDHTRASEARPPAPVPVSNRARVDMHHVVTETIGASPGSPNLEIDTFPLWSGDRVILCTNGLTDVVSEDRIADVLALQRTPEDDCGRLMELALDAGGPDNITIVTADYRIHPD